MPQFIAKPGHFKNCLVSSEVQYFINQYFSVEYPYNEKYLHGSLKGIINLKNCQCNFHFEGRNFLSTSCEVSMPI